jgi:hypothetical protein
MTDHVDAPIILDEMTHVTPSQWEYFRTRAADVLQRAYQREAAARVEQRARFIQSLLDNFKQDV